MPENQIKIETLCPSAAEAGMRLDIFVSRALGLSRARVQTLAGQGHITIKGVAAKCSRKVRTSEIIQVVLPPPAPPAEAAPEPLPLDIVYKDADVLVVNKPAGMAMHPAAGRNTGTLVNALLYADNAIAGVGASLRHGIVHRLDKDTSGLVIVARTDASMAALAQQFKDRSIKKEYLALVAGKLAPGRGKIETFIARSRTDRKKMAVSPTPGRKAVTSYETAEHLEGATLARIFPETGRTHQIRVHMAHIGHPVLGDKVYGKRRSAAGIAAPRQMLHAARIKFAHPRTAKPMEFAAPLPEDMRLLLEQLRPRSQASSSTPPS